MPARAVATSERTLARHMHAILGKSPLSYFHSLRVERAVHLLKTSDVSADEIAARVGYADAATLRNLLRRRLKLGISSRTRPVDPQRLITTINNAWESVRRRAGVKCRFHDLRHTAYTKMAEAGVAEAIIMA